jgi:UDP-N-acetylmuramyl pentapeptide phosphotransferase/UDP-N-acetylglucosamine-1-phosphate transferase
MEIHPTIQYLLVFVLLFAGIIVYLRLAGRFNIIDKPNQRSSHNYVAIRGGGIVFWLAALLYWATNRQENLSFFAGLTLLCSISFWDDVSSLPNKVRILIHLLSVSLMFWGLDIFTLLPWWLVLIVGVVSTGILNAYNFMDGINGITGLYSLSVLVGLQYVNYHIKAFTPPDFIHYAIMACLVFLFFNYRKHAKCFAGDIGSMAIAFWIMILLFQLMIASGSVFWILFLAVYGVDSVYTILHRLYLKQNIFQAHRMHFFQVLTNERGISHLKVSALYALVQLAICGVVIYSYMDYRGYDWIIGTGIICSLSPVYLLKFKWLRWNQRKDA